ncbi:MAG: hypothetical protein RBU21_07350 [FCB group bacterium]|nr:hypothetical protein [FCB group bacterium]
MPKGKAPAGANLKFGWAQHGVAVSRRCIACCLMALVTPFIAVNAESDDRTRPLSNSPQAILESIQEKGVEAVYDVLWQDGEMWTSIIEGITSGNEEWLAVADLLTPESDGGPGEELDLSRAMAIEANPAAVLSMKSFRIEDCVRFNTMDGEPLAEQLDGLQRRTRAVDSVDEPALRSVRERCLRRMHEEYRWIGQDAGVPTAEPDFSLKNASPVKIVLTPIEKVSFDSRCIFMSTGPCRVEALSEGNSEERGHCYRVSFFRVSNDENDLGDTFIVEQIGCRQGNTSASFVVESVGAYRIELDGLEDPRFIGWYTADSFLVQTWSKRIKGVQCLVTIGKDGQFKAIGGPVESSPDDESEK